jgi:nitroreductase
MDLLKGIKSRRSVRVFQKKVPSKKVIQECLESATWAPNPTNQQPWEFIVVTGERLKSISEIIVETFPQRMREMDPYHGIPKACEERKNETFEQLFTAAKRAGIDSKNLFQKNLTFYGAPVAVFFITYKAEHNLYRHSTVAALQNFLLAAYAKGLGTCWLSSVAACQDEIKAFLELPGEKEIVDGVALGYPVKDSPFNTIARKRVPVKEVIRWMGF